MLTAPDFSKKQIVFVMFNEGEKMALSNSNLVVKSADGKVKLQITCYRLFLVFAVGHCSITSALIQEAKKFGFFIALMTPGFRTYALIGAEKEGNSLLHKKQYSYDSLELAKHITSNKITNQIAELRMVRSKGEAVKEAIETMLEYKAQVNAVERLSEILAYEGLSAKIYFRNHFCNVEWNGRQPRVKIDYINSCLDVGYTLLFTYIDALLTCYGFDTYCGVMHRQFYMRKSLVCDLVEPFRPIIDHTVKKGVKLKQIGADDFIVINHQYRLKWQESSKYVKLFMMPIIMEKDSIFDYIQSYYRAFMKDLPSSDFPTYVYGGQ